MSKIKLISGTYGSRLIDTPGNNTTHPMGNRERQAIFNQIFEYLPSANVLDLFAGSGALGFEAISRGAIHVDFVDHDKVAIKTIKDNAEILQCAQQIKVYFTISQVLNSHDSESCYDLIFADPPYDQPKYSVIAEAIKLLKPAGILVLSHPKIPAPPKFENLKLISNRSYAAANIKIYYKTA
jgi:16S rRNA (guanine966-N2)-methyltransferase